MKTVYQRCESDCGVAALAMLADVSYQQANRFLKMNHRHIRVLSSGKILAGVSYFGGVPLDTRCTKLGDRQLFDLEWDALLRCKLLADGREYGHWAVWDAEEQVIRDPYGFVYPIRVDGLVEVARRSISST